MHTRTLYTVGKVYQFLLESSVESATYLGTNREGMHRFELAGGQIWTGHAAPVAPDRKTSLPMSSSRR